MSAAAKGASEAGVTLVRGAVQTPQGLIQVGTLRSIESFLKASGHVVGVLLSDLVKLALPTTAVVSIGASTGAEQAFVASLILVLDTVILAEQKWASSGTSTGAQKLADVIAIVEQPIITLFAQAGLAADLPYILNLINGMVALLNAQPAASFPVSAATS